MANTAGLHPADRGSTPRYSTQHSEVAQLVVQLPVKETVVGSSPTLGAMVVEGNMVRRWVVASV
jgi:hypothetical protein